MACLLVKKHPELSSLIKGNAWQMRVWSWLFQVAFRRSPEINFESLELRILSQASFYEGQPQVKVLDIYEHTLKYFFIKGLIYGTFSPKIAHRVNAIYAQQMLMPLLTESV
jgi:hypothetical protein